MNLKKNMTYMNESYNKQRKLNESYNKSYKRKLKNCLLPIQSNLVCVGTRYTNSNDIDKDKNNDYIKRTIIIIVRNTQLMERRCV